MTRHRGTVRVSRPRGANAIERVTLANGLRVVAVPLPHLHEVRLDLRFRAGSRFETTDTNGLSHYLEHAAHTPRLFHALEGIGGDLDAGTSEDDVIFQVDAPAESFDEVSRILAEMVTHAPHGSHVENEQARVLEEILGEAKVEWLDDVTREHVFPKHALGFHVMGGAERVESFDERDLRNWHRRFFVAANAVLVVAGPVSSAHVMRRAGLDFGLLPSGERAAVEAPPEQTKAHVKPVSAEGDETDVRIVFRVPAATPAVDALCLIVHDGDDSRLLRGPLVSRCYEASCRLIDLEDTAYLETSVAHRKPAPVVAEVLSTFAELARKGPTEVEMERMRRRLAWRTTASLDSAEDVASHYAREAILDREPQSVEAHPARISAVTARELRDLARAIVRPEGLTVVAAGPHQGARTAVREVVQRWEGYVS